MLVRDVMSKPPVVAGDDLATKARAVFNKTGVRAVYTVDPKGRLGGVIDREDVINLKAKRSDLTSKDIALPVPVSLSPETYVLDAALVLVDANVVDAPVVDGDGHVIGSIDANSLIRGFLERKYNPKAGKISDFMTKKVISASYDEPIEKIVSKLDRFRSLPVLKSKRLVGILTRADVISHARFRKQKSASVERIMKTPAVSVELNDDTERAAALLVKNNFNALPVVDNRGSLKGIVTRYDLLKAYAKG